MLLVLFTYELGKTTKKTHCNVNLTLDWTSESSAVTARLANLQMVDPVQMRAVLGSVDELHV